MRSFILAAGLLAGLLSQAFAQSTLPAPKAASRVVTVLSDGLSEPAGPGSQVLSELSIALDRDSDVRVLSINGYGGVSNVRDLLQLRGTDFAILNSDVLSYLDLGATLPEARKRIRLVAPLVQQRVLLFAKRDIKGIDGLRGRKVGILANLPSREITAKTIFGSLKINADIVETDPKDPAKKPQDLDAVLLYEKDLAALQALGVASATHRLLPIPPSGPLAATYLPRKLGKGTLPGFDAEGLDTVQVATVLAAFDWTAKAARYADAITLADRIFAVAPKFWQRNPTSPFSRTDIRTPLPGWKYFGPAEVLAKAAPAAPIKDDTLVLAMPAPQASSSSPASSSSNTLRIMAVRRPPLLNSQDKDGGLLLKILTAALEAAGVPVAVQWADSEKVLLGELTASKTADIGLFFQAPQCDTPTNQSALEAGICDQAALTDPLMQAVIAVFTPLDMPLDPKNADATQNQTLCIPDNQAVPEGTLEEIPWIKAASVKIMRPKSLVNCLVALQQHEAAGLIAIEPEVRFTVEKLALTQSFQIAQRPGATVGLHAAIAKENPRQAELIQTVNEALAKFKASSAYPQVIASHIADLTGR
jgi:ABC-type amino acid transport substrate-binding protein